MLTSLAPILVSLGAPILGSILRTNVGGPAGEASAKVIEALADAVGAQPTPGAVKKVIEADPNAAPRVQTIERERSSEWIAYLTMATAQRNQMLDREDERGSVFSWGWRPAISWLLLFLWSWNGVILPVVNATAGALIVPIPWEHLLGFAGLSLAIYGGGHTIGAGTVGQIKPRAAGASPRAPSPHGLSTAPAPEYGRVWWHLNRLW